MKSSAWVRHLLRWIHLNAWICFNSVFYLSSVLSRGRKRYSCIGSGEMWAWPNSRKRSKTAFRFVKLSFCQTSVTLFSIVLLYPTSPLLNHLSAHNSYISPVLFPSGYPKGMHVRLEGFIRSYCRSLHCWLGFWLSVKASFTPTHNSSCWTVMLTQTLSTPQQTVHANTFQLLLIRTLG